MTRIAKIIELVGSSEQGWTEAAQAALDEAKKTIKEITGLQVSIREQEQLKNTKLE